MRGRDIIGLVLVGVVLTVAVGGYLVYELQSNDDKSADIAQDKKNEARQQNRSSTAKQQPVASRGIQVQGIDDSSSDSTPSVPGPESFSLYEQHANAESPLYTDIVLGTGTTAQHGDRVAVLYKGWLTNGQLFDQTATNEQGQLIPFIFQLGVGQVIEGWDLGVDGMKKGGKRRLIVPSAFGYGTTGKDPIPPNAMMVFDIELLDVAPQQQQGP